MKSMMARLLKFLIGFIAVFGLGGLAFADAGTGTAADISGVVGNMQKNVLEPILSAIVAISYLAGAGFIVGAIFKFKAHKDNPTQVTVGTPVMLLFVGVALLFFPAIVSVVMTSMGLAKSGGSLTFTNTGSF